MTSNNLLPNPTIIIIQFLVKFFLFITSPSVRSSFLLSCAFLTPFLLLGQTSTSFCGYYQAVPPNGTNPDLLVYDRFGNVFDLEDLAVPQQASTSVCNSGHFNPTWVGNPSQTVQEVVCEVLGYISTVVSQRQGQNDCGMLPTEPIEIQVGWISFSNPDQDDVTELGMALSQFPLPSTWSGLGSPFYPQLANDNNCNEIILDRVFIKMNGGRVIGGNVIDGRLLLNSDVTWNYNTTATTFSEMDLFSVTLHEMMHTMGFSSLMGSIGAFSLWDQTLRIVDEYDPGGGGTNPQAAIVSTTNCGRNCWETVSGFGNIAINSCGGSGPDVVIGDAAIAPIAGTPLVDPSQLDDFTNMLSHLSMTCNGQNQPYVMRPVLNPGEYQRTITIPEQQIFCALGYLMTSYDCDGCYVIAQQDAFIEPDAECCFKPFYVCVGESLEILNEELLCNDLSKDGQIAVTDLWHQPATGTPIITVAPNSNGTGWIVTVPPNVSQFQNTSLTYTLSGCGCTQHNGRVRLLIDHYCPTTEFTSDLCDNLLRDGDFEDAINNTSNPNLPPFALGGWPILFQGNNVPATPDMHHTRVL